MLPMLNRHFNSREIINAGEALVDALFSDFLYQLSNYHILHGLLLSRNHSNRTGRGECDFVLICEYGVLVLEVKGGLIRFSENKIIQKDIQGNQERNIDPFLQVRGNCQSIKETIKTKTRREVFVGEAV